MPQNILIRTKLYKPQISASLVPRPWLLEWLSQHQQRPLTLVCASAGYGKTTLISSWLEAVESPSAWVSLDEYDNNLTGFLTYFIAAIQTIVPEAGQETLALLNAPSLPPLPVLARSLISELAQLTDPFILVLDDYYVIREAAIHDLLSELLRHPPRAMHLVIITRSDPPLPITKFRARAQVTEVRSQELRFTTVETAAFLQQVGEQVDDTTAAYLAQKTEGWITGLRLATLSLRHRGDIDLLLKSMPENSRYVTDYLLAEVLNRLEPAIQDFLLKTSILDRLCGPLCDYVTGLDEPECDGLAYLAWLLEQNLFTIPLDDQHHWYRYHHLFQQLLQHQLELKLTTEAIAALHMRAGTWYAENGSIDESLHYALIAGDLSAAAQLVEQNRHTPLNEDKWPILEKWLAKLPDEIVQQRPALLMAKAWVSTFQGAFWAIPPILRTVETMLETKPIEQSLAGEVDFFKAVLLFWESQIEPSLELFCRALEQIPTTHLGARNEAEIYFATASQMAGQGETAAKKYRQILFNETLDGTRKIRLLASLIFIHLLSGELIQANEVAQQMADMADKTNNSFIDAWSSYKLGYIHYKWNNLETAGRHFSQAIKKRYFLDINAPIDNYAGLMFSYQATQQPDKANETLNSMLEFARQSNNPDYLTLAHAAQARLSLLQGDLESAVRWSKTADISSDAGTMLFWLDMPRITHCRVLVAQGSEAGLGEATEKLQEHWQLAQSTHNTPQMIDILLLQALTYHKQAQPDEALAALETAVPLGQPGGFIRPFVETCPELIGHLKKLQSQGLTPDYIGQILNAFENDERGGLNDESSQEKIHPSSLAGQGLSPQPLVDPLTDRELDVLELLAQRFSNKEIAAQLVISPLTVKKHTVNIYQKLQVKNRREAVSQATALGLVSDRPL